MLNLILFIDWLIGAYIWIIIIQAVLSWLIAFNVINTNNRFVYSIGNALYQLTEPVVGRVRRFLPTPSGIDFSPMVVIIGLIFLQRVALRWVANSLVTGM